MCHSLIHDYHYILLNYTHLAIQIQIRRFKENYTKKKHNLSRAHHRWNFSKTGSGKKRKIGTKCECFGIFETYWFSHLILCVSRSYDRWPSLVTPNHSFISTPLMHFCHNPIICHRYESILLSFVRHRRSMLHNIRPKHILITIGKNHRSSIQFGRCLHTVLNR